MIRYSFVQKLIMVVFFLVFVTGSVLFLIYQSSILESPKTYEYYGSAIFGLIIFLAIGILTSFIHELSHALMCIHYGIKPGEIGFMIFNFLPLFYVDVSESWLCNRRERIFITVSGPLSNLFIGFLTLIIWYFFFPEKDLLLTITYFCLFSFVMNLHPLLPFDGYYLLIDLFEIPDLRQEFISLFRMEKQWDTKSKYLLILGFLSVLWSLFMIKITFGWLTHVYTETISFIFRMIIGTTSFNYYNMARLGALCYILIALSVFLITSLSKFYKVYLLPLLTK